MVLSDGSILEWVETDTDFEDYLEYRHELDGTGPPPEEEATVQASA